MSGKWEYTRAHGLAGNALDVLNELGADGWELVTAFHDHFYFKRPIMDQPAVKVTKRPAARKRTAK